MILFLTFCTEIPCTYIVCFNPFFLLSSSLEMVLEVPSKSHLEISIEFEKSLLKWLEYPPDANKGFYVNSALISTVLEDKTNFTGKMVVLLFNYL